MHKFSPALVFVSILSVLWSVDSIILVAQLGSTSPIFYNAGVAGFLFPLLVLVSPRFACWVGITVVAFELLISVLLFLDIFISWGDPMGVNVRVFGVLFGFVQSMGAIFLYYLTRFSLFALAGMLLVRENVRTRRQTQTV